MKFILIFIVGIIFLIFLLSSVAFDTSWFPASFSIYIDKISNYIPLVDIRQISLLLLSSFLIAYGIYNKRVIIAFYVGSFFGMTIIINLLTSYILISNLNQSDIFSMPIHAKNTLGTASSIYSRYGTLIEYYDYHGNIQKFKPLARDIKQREFHIKLNYRQNSIPFYIVLSFLIMILAYYLGNKIRDKKIKTLSTK